MFIALSLLLVAVCLIPAVAKLAGHPKMRHAARHFGIAWRRYRLTHRRAHDSVREALPAVLALVVSGTYLAVAQ